MINRILNCDAVTGMRSLPNDHVPLTVTSPPYDDLRDYGGHRFNFEEIATELFRVTKPGGVTTIARAGQARNSRGVAPGSREIYSVEMTEEHHRDLAAVLCACQGKVVLSGYPSALYDVLYRSWRTVSFDLPNNAAGAAVKAREIERLWLNWQQTSPAAFARFDDTARDFHDTTVRPRRFIARGHLQPSQDDKRPGSQSQGDRATTSLG